MTDPSPPRPLAVWPILAVALLVRVALLLATDRVDVDVLRYFKVGTHLLDVSWNPYQAPRLYPYPPVWMWVEAGSVWLARASGISFALLVRLPVLAAELGLIVLIARWAGPAAAWAYAIHPVSLLVSACHGQFDAIAMLFVLLAIVAQRAGRFDRAALCLAMAVGLKSFPILLLPVFLLATPSGNRVRWALLATAPVAVALVPFAWHDAGAVRRELFGYGGVADFGWIAIVRAVRFLTTGALARSEAVHWTPFVQTAKALFAIAYALLVARWWRAPRPPELLAMCLAVLLLFLTLYGALSAQYLLWVVPLGVLAFSREFVAWSALTLLALLAFYLFLAPGVLRFVAPGPHVGLEWAIGVCVQWLATAVWCVQHVRREALT